MTIEYKAVGEYCPEVLNIHESYLESRYKWTLSRDFIKGDSAVKRKNDLYLPIPSGFLVNSETALASVNQNNSHAYNFDQKYDFLAQNIYDDPNYHAIKPYSIYKHGAKTPDILKHTVNGLLGLIIKKPMQFINDDDDTVYRNKLKNGFDNEKWLEKVRKTMTGVLSYGRAFITLNKDNLPVIYNALDVPNWKEGEFVIFLETKEGYAQNPGASDPREYVRVSFLNGITYYERFDSSGILLERKETAKFKSIPILCIGATDLDWDVDILPLEGIATCALHIYKKTADLSYSEFSSCVPTMVMTGVDDSADNKLIGGGVALTISNDLAKVFYPQTDTNALQHVKVHIDGLFEEAKIYGASLLGGDKTEVESAEAIRLRQGAAGASLSTMTRNVERGINLLLEMAHIDYRFAINFDLEENYMTPQEQSVLLDSWMNRGISYKTYFNNMQKAGLIEDEREIEDELADIEEEKAKKAKEAQDLMEKQASLKVPSPTDISTETNDESSPGRTKNMNRVGMDYEKQ